MRFGFREVIFLIVLLAVPVASGWYVFKPRNDAIKEARAQITAKQQKLEKLQALTERIDDLEVAIERGREAITEIEQKLPSRKHVEGILEQVWQIAGQNQLAVKSVKGEDAVKAAGYLELPLKVVMEGQFDGFYQFLLELEALSRITQIREMKVERLPAARGGNTRPGSMKTEFTLSIYFEP